MVLDGKEDDETRKGDAPVQGRGEDVVVLLPPGGLIALQVVHEEDGEVETGREVTEVERGPEQHSVYDQGRMDVAEPREGHKDEDVERHVEGRRQTGSTPLTGLGPGALDRPPEEGEEEAQQETVLQRRVDLAEDPLRADRAPDDRAGEVNLGSVLAVEVLGLVRRADTGDVIIHELDHAVADERRDDGARDLAAVHGAGRKLGVQAHLLVRDVVVRLAVDVVAKGLDKHQRLGMSRQRVSDDQLRDDVQSFGGPRDGIQVGHRDQEHHVQPDDEEDGPDRGLQVGKLRQEDEGEDEGDDHDGQEPPVGDLGVVPHHIREGIVEPLVHGGRITQQGIEMVGALADLAAGERPGGGLEAGQGVFDLLVGRRDDLSIRLHNRSPGIEEDEDEGERVKGKEGPVHNEIAGAVEGRRVGLELGLVEHTVLDDARDVV